MELKAVEKERNFLFRKETSGKKISIDLDGEIIRAHERKRGARKDVREMRKTQLKRGGQYRS